MSGPAWEIRTTPTEFKVWCWIKSRHHMDAIGERVGRRVTRKDFDTQPLIIPRKG